MDSDVFTRSSHGIKTYNQVMEKEIDEVIKAQKQKVGSREIKKRSDRTKRAIRNEYDIINEKIAKGEESKYIAGVFKIPETIHKCVQINLNKHRDEKHFPNGITNIVTGISPSLLGQLDLYICIRTAIKNYLEAAEATRKAIIESFPSIQQKIFVAAEPWGITSNCYGIGRSINWLVRFDLNSLKSEKAPVYAPILCQLPLHSIFPVPSDQGMESPILFVPVEQGQENNEIKETFDAIGEILGLSDISEYITLKEKTVSWESAADLGFLLHVFDELSIKYTRLPLARTILDGCRAHIAMVGNSCGADPVSDPQEVGYRLEDVFGARKGQLNEHVFGFTNYVFNPRERSEWRILQRDFRKVRTD